MWIHAAGTQGVDVLRPSTLLAGQFDEDTLLRFGILYGPSVRSGQWWRLVTFNVQHLGLLHFAFNAFALHSLGPIVEGLFGAGGFSLLFVGAGVISAAASQAAGLGGSGASGALFGFMGAILVRARRGRTAWDAHLASRAASWAISSFVFGLLVPNVNQVAHVVGFLAGAAFAWLLPRATSASRRGLRAAEVASVALLAVGLLACVWHFRDPIPTELSTVRDTIRRLDAAADGAEIGADGLVEIPREEVVRSAAALRGLPPRHRREGTALERLANVLDGALARGEDDRARVGAAELAGALESAAEWFVDWRDRTGYRM
jgi:rhomboid protease GluP